MLPISKTFLHLSQGQLKLLEKCPREFQHTCLEQLYSPNNQEHEELQNLGSYFHLLMHQQEIGLPVDSFLQADDQLQRWMSNLTEVAPEIVYPNICDGTSRYSEHYRILQVDDYLLTVIYDLLILEEKRLVSEKVDGLHFSANLHSYFNPHICPSFCRHWLRVASRNVTPNRYFLVTL